MNSIPTNDVANYAPNHPNAATAMPRKSMQNSIYTEKTLYAIPKPIWNGMKLLEMPN